LRCPHPPALEAEAGVAVAVEALPHLLQSLAPLLRLPPVLAGNGGKEDSSNVDIPARYALTAGNPGCSTVGTITGRISLPMAPV